MLKIWTKKWFFLKKSDWKMKWQSVQNLTKTPNQKLERRNEPRKCSSFDEKMKPKIWAKNELQECLNYFPCLQIIWNSNIISSVQECLVLSNTWFAFPIHSSNLNYFFDYICTSILVSLPPKQHECRRTNGWPW